LKIDEILLRYLLKNRKVTLQGLGTFFLNKDTEIPADADPDTILPAEALSFEYNPKANADDELVNFIVQQTKKIKPLASADLDSYIALGKQFLNIGKPFTIDGLGTLEKSQEGTLLFKAGVFVIPKIEAPKTIKENQKEVSSGFFGEAERRPPPNYDKRILTIIALVITLCLAGWAIYYFVAKKNKQKNLVETTVKDTVNTIKQDTVPLQKLDTAKTVPDSMNIYLIFKDSLTKRRAFHQQAQWVHLGRPVEVYTKDSVYFRLGEHYIRPLIDTTVLKDSLIKYYGKNIHIDTFSIK
jgi:hypothetical protein